MRNIIVPALLSLLIVLCSGFGGTETIELAKDVLLKPVQSPADRMWVLETFGEWKGNKIGANGLVVLAGEEALLVDPGWHPAQTERLLEFLTEEEITSIRAVFTHEHADRTAGLEVLRKRGIPILASSKTFAEIGGSLKGDQIVDDTEIIELGGQKVTLYYPGPAHASGNIVVAFERLDVLFGGCMIKDTASQDLGNLSDADLDAWPASMRAVMTKFPGSQIIVPGHGAPGGRELMEHTLALAEAAKQKKAAGK